MTRYVIDASAAVEYLLKTPLGESLALVVENAMLLAPELMDVEVVAVLRQLVAEDRALAAVDDLGRWPVERISHRTLARSAWLHRHNVSAYDAFYIASARATGASLLTADGRLARAPELGIAVHNVRLG